MTSCQQCGLEAEFLYTCRECGERFCAEHVDPEDHDCPAVPTEEGELTDSRRVVLAVGFFAVIVGSLATFVWVLGPTGPSAGPDGVESGTTTAEEAATGRLVLQAVNDIRNEANRSSIGYYEPLADRARNRSWTLPEDTDGGAIDLGGGVTCTRLESLEFEGAVQPGRSATEAEAVVATWAADSVTREVLLAEGWDLGGAVVNRIDGERKVRLLVCNSTA